MHEQTKRRGICSSPCLSLVYIRKPLKAGSFLEKTPNHAVHTDIHNRLPAGFGCPRGGTCRWSAERTARRRSPVPQVLGIGGGGNPQKKKGKRDSTHSENMRKGLDKGLRSKAWQQPTWHRCTILSQGLSQPVVGVSERSTQDKKNGMVGGFRLTWSLTDGSWEWWNLESGQGLTRTTDHLLAKLHKTSRVVWFARRSLSEPPIRLILI